MCNARHLIPAGILLRCVVPLSRSLAVYLYSASGSLFTEDVLLNRIAEKLRISFSDQMNRLTWNLCPQYDWDVP